jgi:hypothetical protein
MKYADSFHHLETLGTEGTTTYSPWFDIDFANEMWVYVDSTETGDATSESVVATVERYTPYRTASHVTIATMTTITGDTTEEKYYKASSTEMGTRIRFKYVTSGTWTVTNMKIYCTIYAKRN